MSLKSQVTDRIKNNRLRVRVTAMVVIAVILMSIPIHMYFLFLEVMQRGEEAYDRMIYRAIQVENEVRQSGGIDNIPSSFFEAIVARDEDITVISSKSDRIYNFYSQEEPRQTSKTNKKIASSLIDFLADRFKRQIAQNGNISIIKDRNSGFHYMTYSHQFQHGPNIDTVIVKRNVTVVVTKPIERYEKTFYVYLLYFIITSSIFTYFGLGRIFKMLGQAIDKSFKEIEENDYTSRITVTGKYGKEISGVKHKINDILERMKEIVDVNIESMQDVSHEVNNKLTSIKQSVDVLRLYGTDNKQLVDQKLKSIDDNIQRITKVMSTILDLAKLNQGSYAVSSEPHSTKELIENYLQHTRKVFPAYTFISKYDMEESVIFINKEHFFLALNPIIENAVRYSLNCQHIVIQVRDIGCPNNLYIDIINWGIQIEEKEIPHLFERYYRGKKIDDLMEGSGLGLTISKKVMELYNGRIDVKSDDLGKTTFTLVIPFYSKSEVLPNE